MAVVVWERKGPIARIRHWLKRKQPLKCRTCGYEVPVVGPRTFQADLALDHLAEKHPQVWPGEPEP